MTSPIDLLAYTAGGAFAGAAIFVASGLYLTANSFRRRAVWEDHAGLVGKTRTTAGYVIRNAGWRYAPVVAARGAALGAVLVFLLTLFAVGAWEVFISG